MFKHWRMPARQSHDKAQQYRVCVMRRCKRPEKVFIYKTGIGGIADENKGIFVFIEKAAAEWKAIKVADLGLEQILKK